MSYNVFRTQDTGNLVNNYKDVTEIVGCEVSSPMNKPQPTERQLYSNFQKPIQHEVKSCE